MSDYQDNNNSIANTATTDYPKTSEEGHHEVPVARVRTSGPRDEFIHIGDSKVYKQDLVAAFGGTLTTGLRPAPSRKFANPTPLGLCGFALTTFVLSLVNVHARHVTAPNIVIGLAFFYGGLIQLIAGIWEIAVENTFGATALASYGGFWMSFAAILTPWFGIQAAYPDPADFNSVLGFFLTGWFIFTFLLVLCTFRSTVAVFSLFASLDLTFLLLAAGYYKNHVGVLKAGGWFGIITAFIAWYNAFAGLADSENFFFNIKPIYMPGARTLESQNRNTEEVVE